jgi:hypothetical protein
MPPPGYWVNPYLLLAIASAVLAFFLLLEGQNTAKIRDALAEHGVDGTAEINRLAIGGTRGKTTRYLVDYAIELDNGSRYLRSESIAEDYWRRLEVGDSVPVRYVPSDPSVSQIQLTQAETSAHLFTLIGRIVALLALIFALLLLFRSGKFP